ncbi:hypothetical protein K474DRAFT_1771180 [Panus rudis PR-1116 ss-1]|nr:hypothetical protein K474DRAFT_1771180 [Panus rudis PR-1116 ss-1]
MRYDPSGKAVHYSSNKAHVARIVEQKLAFHNNDYRPFHECHVPQTEQCQFHDMLRLLTQAVEVVEPKLPQLYSLIPEEWFDGLVEIIGNAKRQARMLAAPRRSSPYMLTLSTVREYTASIVNAYRILATLSQWAQSEEFYSLNTTSGEMLDHSRVKWLQTHLRAVRVDQDVEGAVAELLMQSSEPTSPTSHFSRPVGNFAHASSFLSTASHSYVSSNPRKRKREHKSPRTPGRTARTLTSRKPSLDSLRMFAQPNIHVEGTLDAVRLPPRALSNTQAPPLLHPNRVVTPSSKPASEPPLLQRLGRLLGRFVAYSGRLAPPLAPPSLKRCREDAETSVIENVLPRADRLTKRFKTWHHPVDDHVFIETYSESSSVDSSEVEYSVTSTLGDLATSEDDVTLTSLSLPVDSSPSDETFTSDAISISTTASVVSDDLYWHDDIAQAQGKPMLSINTQTLSERRDSFDDNLSPEEPRSWQNISLKSQWTSTLRDVFLYPLGLRRVFDHWDEF